MKAAIGFLRVCWVGFALLIANVAWGDAEADFEQGVIAHNKGDVIAALELLQRAADQGHVGAMVRAGFVLATAGESESAFALYSRAAEAGNAEAILTVGVMLANGEGVPKDPGKALERITRAANLGHGPARVVLAQIYLRGGLDLPPSREEAVFWLEKAIADGYEPARSNLEALRAENAQGEQEREEDD